MENKQYDAFISYRHSELDQFVAEALHRGLEAFRLPLNKKKRIAEENRGKTRINRVFRDKEELPLASDLAAPITEALRNSDFLIVVCTPRLPQSKWCRMEIETFIQMHGRECVLAVLAEGEPEESFPESLRYIEQDGIRKAVEPLAADVRGSSKREIRRKIKAEILRLAAPMFHCDYDDLKQRQRERKWKRIVGAALAAGAVCAAFGVVSMTMALKISRQSEQIKVQMSESLAEESLDMLAEGDRMGAVEASRKALEISYTPRAQQALTEALYVYQNNNKILPDSILQQETEVNFTELSADGNLLLMLDKDGKLCVWNVPAGQKIFETELEGGSISWNEDKIGFLGNDRILYPGQEGFTVYDLNQQETAFTAPGNAVTSLEASADGTYLACLAYQEVTVYGGAAYEEVFHSEISPEEGFGSVFGFAENRRYIAYIETAGGVPDGSAQIKVIDLHTGQLIHSYGAIEGEITQITFDEENLYVSFGTAVFEEGSEETHLAGGIACFPLQQEDAKWVYKTENQYISSFQITEEGGPDLLVFRSFDSLGVLDKNSGNFNGSKNFAREIVNSLPMGNSDLFLVATRDGLLHFFHAETMTEFVRDGKFKAVSDNLKKFHFGNHFYATLAYGDTFVTIHTLAKGRQLELLYEGEASIGETAVNEEETQIAFMEYTGDWQDIVTYQLADRRLKVRIKLDEKIGGITYLDEDTIGIATDNGILQYNALTGELEKNISFDAGFYILEGVLEVKKAAFYHTNEGISVFDMKTGKNLLKIEEEQLSGEKDVYGLGNRVESYAVASKKDKKLKLLQLGKEGVHTEIPFSAAGVARLCFSEDDAVLYATYISGRTEAYRTEDLSLIRTYQDFAGEIEEAGSFGNKGETLLRTSGEGYLLNPEGDVIAEIEGVEAVLERTEAYITAGGTYLYTVPAYDLSMLLEEAENVIGLTN